MKPLREKFRSEVQLSNASAWMLPVALLLTFSSYAAVAQNIIPADTVKPVSEQAFNPEKKRSFKMITLTFGGNGVLVTQINTQWAIMSGGRGSATFNNRFTIGGGGWGMPKGVEVESDEPGVYNFVKMGYGGLEFGYIISPGQKMNFGTNILLAGGALFKETVPQSDAKGFKMFSVIEPSLYNQVSLGKMFRFEAGVTYRYVRGANLPYISDSNLSGFSCYIGFLVKACKCE